MLDKLHKQMAKGDRAKAKLEDETFRDAMLQLEAGYIEAWKATGVNDATAREKLWIAVQMIDKFEDHLISVMNSGKLAAAEIAALSRNKAA